jgi:L-asparaginase II
LSEKFLQCGALAPESPQEAARLIVAGEAPSVLHNTNSGLDGGFLTTALFCDEPLANYTAVDHPVQRRIQRVIEQMCGVRSAELPWGLANAGMPLCGMPLRNVALGAARFAKAARQSPSGAEAQITGALHACPELVSGRGRLTSTLLEASAGRFIVKGGREAVYVAALLDPPLGIAVKVIDGAQRAANLILLSLLVDMKMISAELADKVSPKVKTAAGATIGRLVISLDGRQVPPNSRLRLPAAGAVAELACS